MNKQETHAMNELRVRDLMTPKVITVRPGDSIATAHDLMLDHRFRHLVVADDEGDLVGVLTQRDLLRHSLTDRLEMPLNVQRAVMRRIRVEDVMTSEVETVGPGERLQQAAEVMFENKYGCLPVMEGPRVVGILTEADFVRFFVEAAQEAALEAVGARR
jgi:CBS domain-containing membrane protein